MGNDVAMPHLLLITYYWPPCGGAGVQRWLKMVKYLVPLGWRVTVYTPSNPAFPDRDESLAESIPEGVELVKRPILEPLRLLEHLTSKRKPSMGVGLLNQTKGTRSLFSQLILWVRANCFIPDARFLWIRPSVRYLARWLKANPVDVLVTTGPPHSMHLIGRRLHRQINIPWLADFRAPWVNIDYAQHLPLTRWAHSRHRNLENAVLREATAVSTVSPGTFREFEDRVKGSIYMIPNGYDSEDFQNPILYAQKKCVNIIHVGSLNADRNPVLLWHALSILAKERGLLPDSIKVEFVGSVDVKVRNSVVENGVESYVEFHSSILHSEVPARLATSSLLLLSINDAPRGKDILTGKLFEYLAARRPIVVLGPKDGDAARLVEDTRSGVVFGSGDAEKLADYLQLALDQEAHGGIPNTSGDISTYSREGLARRMDGVLRGMIAK